MKHLDQMFGNFVSNMNSSIQPEWEGDNGNGEINEL